MCKKNIGISSKEESVLKESVQNEESSKSGTGSSKNLFKNRNEFCFDVSVQFMLSYKDFMKSNQDQLKSLQNY